MFTRLPSCKITGAILVALILGCFGLVNAPRADATEGNTHTVVVAQYGEDFTVTTRHGVVLTSTLRHCPLEDGGPMLKALGPCTWNVASTTDGNGVGLAFVMYRHGHRRVAEYVWNTNPTGNGWEWAKGMAVRDCVVKDGVAKMRCADGTYPLGRTS